MQIAIVLVTFNGIKWIEKVFDSLTSLSQVPQIIVVDNGSGDGTLSLIRKIFSGCAIIENGKNLGFGQANNIGIRNAYNAGADYVFLLNQDAWVETDTLSTLMDIAERHPEYGIISPMHLNGKGDALDFNFSNYIAPRRCPGLYSDVFLGKPLKEVYEAEYVNAAAWLLPRKTIETIGGFDPIFFHYGEDDNYVQRVRYHGFKIGVCPQVRIYHDREDRQPGKIQLENRLHRKNLTHYADVNIDGPALLDQRIKSLQVRYWLRSALVFPQKERIQKELKVLKTIRANVVKSWSANRQIGIHHL